MSSFKIPPEHIHDVIDSIVKHDTKAMARLSSDGYISWIMHPEFESVIFYSLACSVGKDIMSHEVRKMIIDFLKSFFPEDQDFSLSNLKYEKRHLN